MNIAENEHRHSMPSTTTPAVTSDRSHGEKSKIMNSTPNGYNTVSNHKIKSDHTSSPHKKHHDSSSKHSDSSKHTSDTVKRKDSDLKPPKPKEGSHKHNNVSRPGHSHDKEKKHHSSSKHSEHSTKHSSSSSGLKNGTDKIKTEIKKEHKSSDGSHKSSDESHKNSDGSHKNSDGSHKSSSDIKKHDKPRDESSSDKKMKDKSKEHKEKKHDHHKHKLCGERPKEKSSSEKHKEKSKDKTSDKHSFGDVKIKQEVLSSPEKKDRPLPPVKIKNEPVSPTKVKEESFSEDDMPLAARKSVKEAKAKPKSLKEEDDEDMDSDDEPISSRLNKLKTKAPTKKRKTEDSDYDSDYKKPVKKVKKEVQKTAKKIKKEPIETGSPKKRVKKEEEQDVWKWWEEEKKEDGVKWKTLQHYGPVFAPLYERVPKNVKFYYDGKHMELSEETEEVAGFYGRMLDHDYTTKEVFNTNFFKDWRKVMNSQEKEKIKDLRKCNFNAYNDYYKLKTEERKAMTKEEKAVIKKENEEMTAKFGFCIIDGHKQKIGNFKIEPPGLFRGRGEHPKMGMLKRRVQPEDISINIGKEADIPTPPAGHKWKKVLHDNKVTWLASWNENILNSTKYIMLNPSSKLKGEKDWQKYETARKLKNFVDEIRRTYTNDFKSKEMKVRQRAVALYFIDKLALRAGNEKDEETADTVGCCSLRVEHITLDDEKDGQEFVVSFDFLGKDSIRYFNSVPVEKRAYKNIKLFTENKQPGDDLFDRLNTSILNKYLNELMEGLTAKVFRTFNASKTLQEQLDKLTEEDMSVPEKLLAYNRANRAVAILCNHQRAIPKTFSKSMENLKGKIDEKNAQIKECKKELKQAKSDAKNSGSMKDKTLLDKKKKRLQQLEEQLQKLEVQATDKEENKQIALGTSKLNYLDPRISVAWCKKWGVSIEKIYNRTQRDKFRWAIEMAGPDFEF